MANNAATKPPMSAAEKVILLGEPFRMTDAEAAEWNLESQLIERRNKAAAELLSKYHVRRRAAKAGLAPCTIRRKAIR